MEITVRPLHERELPDADRIMRRAFGTFIGLPDPSAFMGDADYVLTRWRADPTAAYAAEVDGELAGSSFATNWGSVGFFGPVTVRPELWDRGVGRRLLEPTLAKLAAWGTRHTGLFTFSHSPKHLALYQKFGFHPRFLTFILVRPVDGGRTVARWSRYSELTEREKEGCLAVCRELTEAIYQGLDVRREVTAVDDQRLGDTVLVWEGTQLVGFAVCHAGLGSEAGSGVCYIKFGAARPGPDAAAHFDRLLDGCDAFASGQGQVRLVAGVNTGRHEAYLQLVGRGFHADFVGVAMQRDNEAGYNRSGVYLIDDWR